MGVGVETMNRTFLTLACAAFVASLACSAQNEPTVDQLQRELRQLREEFERQQARQRAQIEALERQIEALRPPTPPRAATNGAPPTPARTASSAPATATNAPSASAASPEDVGKKWSPSDPIRLAGGGQSYLNLSLDGLFAVGGSTASDVEVLEPGGHDPKVRGFTLQGLEMTLDGNVDPYFRGQANLLFQIDSSGESHAEVEEAFLTSLALPGNLQVKGGQFLTEFGRMNATHPHTWTFVDQPLANARLLGPEGLRNLGGRLSWLVPTPFYSELFLAVQNSTGETAAGFRNDNEGDLLFGRPVGEGSITSFNDLLFTPRYALSFDLSDTQALVFGASAAFGPNDSGADTDTQIYGLDLYWKWKPVNHHGGFPFVSWQTEGLYRRYQAGAYDGLSDPLQPVPLPGETVIDYGLYTQVAYGFALHWVAGLRFDYVDSDAAQYESVLGPDPARDRRWRLAPNVTWYPSEFSKLRLQYNYDDRQMAGIDHSVWLQFEFLLGSHAAHKF
jgi:hypothetical protein